MPCEALAEFGLGSQNFRTVPSRCACPLVPFFGSLWSLGFSTIFLFRVIFEIRSCQGMICTSQDSLSSLIVTGGPGGNSHPQLKMHGSGQGLGTQVFIKTLFIFSHSH